ncbi:MAG: HAD-IIA family hydrolase [Humibacillus sp.]|nr:HAD-IIA family hydrolase [Humibacillus sp.]
MASHDSQGDGSGDGGASAAVRSVADAYDGVICDLDGVVYRGGNAVPGAPEALGRLGQAGLAIVYATNNASRPPGEVAAQLTSLGAPCEMGQVVTSAQAGAAHLAEALPQASRVLALGGPGVTKALRTVGLTPVAPSAAHGDDIDAVLQGLGRRLTVRDFEVAARHLTRGARWVATNLDATFPLEWGIAPGNGAYVELLESTTGRTPEVVGKPFPPLYLLATERLGTSPERTLAIGDRLDTDIAGAGAARVDSAWVLTGVDHPSSLFAAPDIVAPTYVVADLAELLEPAAVVTVAGTGSDRSWSCGNTSAHIEMAPDGSSRPRLSIYGIHGRQGVDGFEAQSTRPMDAVRAGIAALLATRDDGRLPLEDLVEMARSLDALVTPPGQVP